MRFPEHHTKRPKKSQNAKALNLHNPKWTSNLNILLYWRLDGLFELFKILERWFFLTQECVSDGISLITRIAN